MKWKTNDMPDPLGVRAGIIISKPGPRPAGEQKQYFFPDSGAAEAGKAVKFANPNARITEMEDSDDFLWVAVDPPMRFEFSHIEWL
jgi:hypothetical protein